MRILLYTGKGGVGKTTVAAATALLAADRGLRTLVLSTDAAHSLGDSFDRELGDEPTSIAPNLWGLEIDVYRALAQRWASIHAWLASVFQWQGADAALADDMAIMPGMEELVGLLDIRAHASSGEYDLVIVDCAPTAETFRLLSFPDVMRWYMERMFPIGKRVNQLLGPVARSMFRMPAPSQDVLASVEGFYRQLADLRTLLTDRDRSAVRLVVNAEKMVVKEAQRTFTWLSLYGYPVDLAVCNRVLPDAAAGGWHRAWRESQQRHLTTVTEAFAPVPVRTAPLLDREAVGLDALRELAAALYGDADPAQTFYAGQPLRVSREDGGPVLTLHLPFLERGDLDVWQVRDELVVRAGRHRRTIALPASLAGLRVRQARREGDEIRLAFGPAAQAGAAAPTRQEERHD